LARRARHRSKFQVKRPAWASLCHTYDMARQRRRAP
jgi:hypothetical protein